MSIVVGYGPEARGNGALDLARMLADSSGQPLAVCCVIPERWEPVSVARSTDAEFERHLGGLAGRALERAQQALAACSVEVSFEVVTARSAPAGLLEAVERHGAALLVVGSSADGAWGHIALGSVTDRLLHSSPVPVAVAPRGHRSPRAREWAASPSRWTGRTAAGPSWSGRTGWRRTWVLPCASSPSPCAPGRCIHPRPDSTPRTRSSPRGGSSPGRPSMPRSRRCRTTRNPRGAGGGG